MVFLDSQISAPSEIIFIYYSYAYIRGVGRGGPLLARRADTPAAGASPGVGEEISHGQSFSPAVLMDGGCTEKPGNARGRGMMAVVPTIAPCDGGGSIGYTPIVPRNDFWANSHRSPGYTNDIQIQVGGDGLG